MNESSQDQSYRNLTFHLKDGGDGAGTMPVLRSKKTGVDENGDIQDDTHMFQCGMIPLKLVNEKSQEMLWQNKAPNSARSLRPVYLIREVEIDIDLLKFVIKETDRSFNDLNKIGLSFTIDNKDVVMFCSFQDAMKDLKFKKLLSGLGDADCILCKSKVKDWVDPNMTERGF